MLSPAAQLAHDVCAPKPAAEDARKVVAGAFDALRAFAGLLTLLSVSTINRQAAIGLVDGEFSDETIDTPESNSPRSSPSLLFI
ncbi:hypothetical protein FRC07_002701 [Ceratobasidium sp. 392]|nr:hypothetical protein FRC07_002701 [Ceratobasidium sp. 392]